TGGGVDYTLGGSTLTFAPGVTTQNITLTVVNDTMDEFDETVPVTLSPTNALPGAITTYTYTILDDDPPPSISINNATVTEGNNGNGQQVIFTVTLSAASGKTVSVAYATADGTAVAGTDY